MFRQDFFVILFYGKNINRIINHLDLSYNNFPWPMIYSMSSEDTNEVVWTFKDPEELDKILYHLDIRTYR